jgi:hypothetical protein
MSKPFFAPSAKSKPSRPVEAVDIAARHLVYKLYEATDGVLGAWHALGKISERRTTVVRAVERNWVLVREDGPARSASLTSEGRLLARKSLR